MHAKQQAEKARLAKMAELRKEIARLNGLPEVVAHDAKVAKAAKFLVNASGYIGTTKDGRRIYVVRNAMKTSWLVHAGKDAQLCGAVTILNMFPITMHNAAVDWASDQLAA